LPRATGAAQEHTKKHVGKIPHLKNAKVATAHFISSARAVPVFQNTQGMVEAKCNFRFAALCPHSGNKLALCRRHAALAIALDLERVKLGIVQQDQICHARLDTKTDKARRLDRQTRTAIRGVEPNKAGHRAHSKMLTDGALNGGLIKQRCHNLRGKQMQPGMDFRGMS